ncbi:MAG TPA: glycosyltransferase family 39 protein [Verrucomicrobiae bacterium]|nr:glycosyltransferase family 39 protein [Verrucomicrobiae bacterium]
MPGKASYPAEAIGRVGVRQNPFIGDMMAILLLVSVCLFIGLPRFRSGLDLGDEGLLAYGAARVLDGQVPNRDFVSLQPPLSFYTAAITFKVFGTSLCSLRILGLSLFILIPLLIYGISRNLCGRALSLAAALPATILGLPYFGFVPFAPWQGIAAALASVLFYFRATLGRRRYLAFPAGCLAGCTVLLRQDEGFYLAVSTLVYSLALNYARGVPISKPEMKRVVAFWASGLIAVLLPFGIYWTAKGALPDMFKQLVVFPLTIYAKTSSSPFPSVSSGLTFGPQAYLVLYYLAPLVEILAALELARRFARGRFGLQEATLTFLVAWSALFYCQVLARSDLCHLLITLPPFFILCALCFKAIQAPFVDIVTQAYKNHSASVLAKTIICGLASTAVLCFLWLLTPALLCPALPAADRVPLERAGVRLPGADNLKALVESLQRLAPPGHPILCLPYQPMFYFLCNRPNPTRWNYLWPGDQTLAEHQALIQQARNNPPTIVLTTAEADMQSYAPAILDYVHQEYRLIGDVGGVMRIYVPSGSLINSRLQTGDSPGGRALSRFNGF